MNTLKVELGDRSYPILIGEGLLRQPDLIRQHVPARDILVVSNTTVAPLYMAPLVEALKGSRVVETILPDRDAVERSRPPAASGRATRAACAR